MNTISIKPQPIPEQLGIYSQAAVTVSRMCRHCTVVMYAKFLGGSSNLSMPELRNVVLFGSFCRSESVELSVFQQKKKQDWDDRHLVLL